MSTDNNKSVQGDLAVSRDTTVGGDLQTRGNATVDHDLRVKGRLYIDSGNVDDSYKGLFTSVAKLQEIYPNPRPGWNALVGTSLPAAVYVEEGGKWVATGESAGEPEANLNEYLQSTEITDITTILD